MKPETTIFFQNLQVFRGSDMLIIFWLCFFYYLKNYLVVLGDSMVNKLNASKMSKRNNVCKFSVISFFGVKVEGIKDYIKPSRRERINRFFIHAGTTAVRDQNKSPESIVESTFNLTSDFKVSITWRNNIQHYCKKGKWNKKVDKVNNILQELQKRKKHLFDK